MLFLRFVIYSIKTMLQVILYFKLFRFCQVKMLLCFVVLFLSIWKQRNNKIRSEVTDVHGFVFYRAKTLLENWKTFEGHTWRCG